MHDATSQLSRFRLAIGPGVPSSHLSALLALQRAEEPDIAIAFFEVTVENLHTGLHEGRYDAGLSLREVSDPSLKSQPLWSEDMAVALPLRFPLLDKGKLTVADLLNRPLFRWQAEACPLLDQRLSALIPADERDIQHVTSFEMMALWVAAGYGIGVSAGSRIEHAHRWGIAMRPLGDGPYKIVTHLQQPNEAANAISERFERRALQVAKDAAA
ncbi:transcriptional regulator, LysR family [Acidovorax delafieldii 2AN]|uniref:Transcriptional regulator, LysR family n=1 Tax=Acidovorax delafieldii 2AN TaxID=573060 RepID=C5T3H9_ACIDE|nr:LysR substrate-binding domain-containing protein [Acidovorax delafieldii]EER60975.1 transcriptional regulator, LysR family [Acidovorax delafieldii 2AN]